ncbi:MAG: DUF2520 domain-containing protein [Deltaproteobacteria bacterium]|nr:DUF2520 domain-containing protein [Deltaproteobacteria bacterium]
MKPSFTIVGCGRVGTTLGWHLTQSGYPAESFTSRTLTSAEAIAGKVGISSFGDRPWEHTASADIVFITTPDDVIAEVCRDIVNKTGFRSGSVVLHCSGSLPSTILAPARKNGAYIGSLHPLQSIAKATFDSNPFQGIITAVEGDPQAIESARKIAADLGSRCIDIRTEAKILYHASAVVASNYLVTLMDLSLRLLKKAGIEASDAVDVLYPLVKGTLTNIEKIGIPQALTGPIARGDLATIADHLQAMGRQTPELLHLYKALGSHTVKLAGAKGSLDPSQAEKFEKLLSGKDS